MTRLAIVGSSHTGSVRHCDASLRAEFPDLSITYFGLPGAPFRRAGLDADGVFRARAPGKAQATLIERINGALEIDLAPFDHIWVIGHRYGLFKILQLLMRFDILELRRTGLPDTVSEAFFWAAMGAEIEASCERITAQFGPDPRLTFTPAPYPAEDARTEGLHHDPAMAHILSHPERHRIHKRYLVMMRKALARHGYRLLPQPKATLAGPFATRSAYLRDARDFRDASVLTKDMRHMNADFGYALFQAYAELHPGLGCSISSATPDNKDA